MFVGRQYRDAVCFLGFGVLLFVAFIFSVLEKVPK